MTRVFLDANIVLDLLDNQRAGHEAALRLEEALEENQAICLCAWHTLSIIQYVGAKVFGKEAMLDILRGLLDSWMVPSTGTEEAREAFEYVSGDYEDALQIASAVAGRADYLVTRDKADYRKSPVKAVSPEELCKLLAK
jgi:predicted nucleic acid-binding protein